MDRGQSRRTTCEGESLVNVAKETTKGLVDSSSGGPQESVAEDPIRTSPGRPIKLWHPRIGKMPVRSAGQLLSIISQEHPWLKSNALFRCLLADAERHLDLSLMVNENGNLRYGDLRRLASMTGLTVPRVHRYVRYGQRPRLYWLIETGISKMEAQSRLAQIHKTNCGIRSAREAERRIETYYPGDAFASSRAYSQNLRQITVYFNCMKLLRAGGILGEVAKKLHVDTRQVREWLGNKRRPYFLKLASQIPRRRPGLANKWLPTRVKPGRGFQPDRFIRVPAMVTHWSQIVRVIRQLVPLSNAEIARWRLRFGEQGQEQSFAYLLGMMVSDAGKREKGFTSTGLQLRLSKAYSWSRRVGEATCYCLCLLGIKTRKLELKESSSTSRSPHFWYSEESPILRWIVRSCLGLQEGQCTTHDPIGASWLLSAPDDIRLGFLQGLADGDGSASVKTQKLTIACGCNNQFVQSLLKASDIYCTECGHQIVVARRESILRAVTLPLFKHAQGRQRNAQKIAMMLRGREKQKRSSVPKEVAAQMLDLREHGKSYGEIAEMVFDRHGLSYAISTVIAAVRKTTKE